MTRWLFLILIIIFLQVIFSTVLSDSIFLPSPLEVFNAFIFQLNQGVVLTDILMSLKRVITGFTLSVVIAVPLAILCGYSQRLSSFVKPFVELLRPIPPIAWIPIAILLFGLGDQSAYFIVFLGAFFPIFTSTYFGASSLPVVYRNIAQSFEIKKNVFITKILFYFSLPYVFNGLKTGMGMAWMSVIAAELIGAQSGLGYFIQVNRLLLRIDNIVMGMVLIGIIGYALVRIIAGAEYVSTPWLRRV